MKDKIEKIVDDLVEGWETGILDKKRIAEFSRYVKATFSNVKKFEPPISPGRSRTELYVFVDDSVSEKEMKSSLLSAAEKFFKGSQVSVSVSVKAYDLGVLLFTITLNLKLPRRRDTQVSQFVEKIKKEKLAQTIYVNRYPVSITIKGSLHRDLEGSVDFHRSKFFGDIFGSSQYDPEYGWDERGVEKYPKVAEAAFKAIRTIAQEVLGDRFKEMKVEKRSFWVYVKSVTEGPLW